MLTKQELDALRHRVAAARDYGNQMANDLERLLAELDVLSAKIADENRVYSKRLRDDWQH